MNEMEIRELSQCAGKFAFREPRMAQTVARRKKGLNIYKCPHCRSWHVGRAPNARHTGRR